MSYSYTGMQDTLHSFMESRTKRILFLFGPSGIGKRLFVEAYMRMMG